MMLPIVLVALALASAERVTLRVYSGTEDPSWDLSDSQVATLRKMISTHTQSPTLNHIMGYTGFEVRSLKPIVPHYLLC